jgi:rhodanese-related sulfurtransferase
MKPATRRRILWGAVSAVFFVALALPAVVETARGRDRVEWQAYTPAVPAEEVGRMIAEGRKVIFVDVREPEEHREFHIPGSRLIPLRALHSADLSEFEGADAVVAYCLKDFRGWEGCKILVDRGVKNVFVLDGWGVAAWKAAKLPLVGETEARSEEEALREIRDRYARDRQ